MMGSDKAFKRGLRIFATLIQLGILYVIARNFIAQKDFNKEQLEFNRVVLRPWVYCVFDTTIAYDPCEISADGIVKFNLRTGNVGATPAAYLTTYTLLSNYEEYPEEALIERIKKKPDTRDIFLFPRERLTLQTDTMRWAIESVKVTYSHIGDSVIADTEISKPTRLRSRREVIDGLRNMGGVYLHTYNRYYGFDGKKYGLRNSFYVRYTEKGGDTLFEYLKRATLDLPLTIENR